MLLGGDIGGTKTNLGLFEIDNSRPILKVEEKFSSHNHKSLDEIVENFLKKHPAKVKRACFGIAGPIKHETVKTTNLPWEIEAAKLSTVLSNCPVHLINDLEANAWGIRSLKESELCCLQKTKNGATGNQALISAGTGLGEAGLFFDGKAYHPFATEAGHADFSPRNKLECQLLEYLQKSFGHVSYERVLSGQGLYNIYQFLNAFHNQTTPEVISSRFKSEDPAKVISEMALENKDNLCRKALEMMVQFYGAEAGNLALRLLATGGLYLGGGIAPKIIQLLQKPLFLDAFRHKGRFQSLLESIPVYVIQNANTALLGAAECAASLS